MSKRRKDGLLMERVTDPVTKKRICFYGHTEKEIREKIFAWREKRANGRTVAHISGEVKNTFQTSIVAETREKSTKNNHHSEM